MFTSDKSKKGKSTEHFIISKLLRNDFDVFIPIVDKGIDILIKSVDGAYVELQIKGLTISKNNTDFSIKGFIPKENFFIVCHNLVTDDFFVMPSFTYYKNGVKQKNKDGKIDIWLHYTKAIEKGYKNEEGIKLLERAIQNPHNTVKRNQ